MRHYTYREFSRLFIQFDACQWVVEVLTFAYILTIKTTVWRELTDLFLMHKFGEVNVKFGGFFLSQLELFECLFLIQVLEITYNVIKIEIHLL